LYVSLVAFAKSVGRANNCLTTAQEICANSIHVTQVRVVAFFHVYAITSQSMYTDQEDRKLVVSKLRVVPQTVAIAVKFQSSTEE
jgi:hypothetical protein